MVAVVEPRRVREEGARHARASAFSFIARTKAFFPPGYVRAKACAARLSLDTSAALRSASRVIVMPLRSLEVAFERTYLRA